MSEIETRKSLSRLLRRSQAHAGLSRAVDGFPVALADRKPNGFRHTAWQQVEHLRLAAEDPVSYCLDADYEELGWPEGYWPDTAGPPSGEAWRERIAGLLQATEAMAALVENREHDLYTQVPPAANDPHHTLRAALILLLHHGYHAGPLNHLRLHPDAWPPT